MVASHIVNRGLARLIAIVIVPVEAFTDKVLNKVRVSELVLSFFRSLGDTHHAVKRMVDIQALLQVSQTSVEKKGLEHLLYTSPTSLCLMI